MVKILYGIMSACLNLRNRDHKMRKDPCRSVANNPLASDVIC